MAKITWKVLADINIPLVNPTIVEGSTLVYESIVQKEWQNDIMMKKGGYMAVVNSTQSLQCDNNKLIHCDHHDSPEKISKVLGFINSNPSIFNEID